jgi:glucokinase-like ROK family protein
MFRHMFQTPPSADVIYRVLRARPETTRTEICARTGLSKATVSEMVSQFLANGLVTETGKRHRGRGRHQVVLQLQAKARLVIGAEFNERGCRVVLADLRAAPICFAERLFSGTDASNFVDALAECVSELRAQADAPIVGIGIGVPGLVDPLGRTVVVSVPFRWRNVAIASFVEERTGLPTRIANRAKAAALGEYWQGDSHDVDDRTHLVYVTIGAGIAAGLVIEGEPYYGHDGTAGELGHTTVEASGPRCGCGNDGCLHMLASESAIIRSVRATYEATPDHIRASQPPLTVDDDMTIKDLQVLAHEGHPLVAQAVAQAARYLGIAIGNLVNIVNPSHLILGGSIAAFGDVLLVPLRAEIQRRTLWDARKRLNIRPSNLGDDVGPIGGAALYLSGPDRSRIVQSRQVPTMFNSL